MSLTSSLEQKFKHELLGNHSVAKVKYVSEKIQSKQDLQALLNLIHPDHDYPTPEAAAWCIRHASSHLKEYHSFIAEGIIQPLQLFNRDSLIKNIIGTLKVIEIPKTCYGEITNYCFDFLTQPTRSKAVLYYSMEVMTKICKAEPELQREFCMIMDDLLPLASEPLKRKYLKVRKGFK